MTRSEVDAALDELLERISGSSPTGVSSKSSPPRVRTTRRLRAESPPQPLPPGPKEDPPKPPAPLTVAPAPEHKVLWSERHPTSFSTSRLILPRIPVLLIVVPLVYAMVMNLLKGEYLFLVRWYHESWVLPRLVKIMSSQQALSDWWSIWGPVTILSVLTMIVATVVLYFAFWRILFKDYTRHTEGVETAEGRLYWIEGQGVWYNIWDGLYAPLYRRKFKREYRPQRKNWTLYVNTRFRLNPLNPAYRMMKIHMSKDKDEWVERRGPYEVVGHEGLYRRIVGIRHLETHTERYESAPISLPEAKRVFKGRGDTLVQETQKFTRANVEVRLDKMKSGTVVLDDEFRAMMLHERQKKTGTGSNQ